MGLKPRHDFKYFSWFKPLCHERGTANFWKIVSQFFFFFLPFPFSGLLTLGLLLLISVHTYTNKNNVHAGYNSPNYYGHDHHSGEEGGGMYVNLAGSKKLQQSSNYLPENNEEGVKFLPVIK